MGIRSMSIGQAAIVNREGTFRMGNDLLIVDSFSVNEMKDGSTQLGFLLLCFCKSGEVSFTLGGVRRTMKKGDLLVGLGGQVFKELSASSDFEATVVMMSRSYAQDCIIGLSYLWPYLLYVMSNPVVSLNEEEQLWIMDCYQLLRRRLGRDAGLYLRETVVALTRAFYFEICSLLDKRAHMSNSPTKRRAYAIFDRFIHLASQHFRTERTVEWYSSEMCLTPKHLSEMVKMVSGRTAGQWLTTMVMIETKTLLQDTQYSIKEIAQMMNFQNQSFLGKYFKNIEGISPSDFRKLHGID